MTMRNDKDKIEQVIIDLSQVLLRILTDRYPEKPQEEQKSKSFLTIKQLIRKYPWLTEGTVRWYITKKNENGFDKVLKKVGKKILIDEEKFLLWIDKGTEKK